MGLNLLILVPWLPLIGAILCGVCCFRPAWRAAAGWICTASIAASFLLAMLGWSGLPAEGVRDLTAFRWMQVGSFEVNFSYFVDQLTMLMLLVVTGVGTLISIYAMGYMKGDRGYARFFGAVALFIFAMTTLVMADNLVLLYLGWEGVGLCSYLLIGFYHHKPEAVAAAKKAFIVNRVGDLGFAIGIFLTFFSFGTVYIPEIVERADSVLITTGVLWIPYLLMLGAFGKSAQFPLHVWLPDAMAGPTPVSALVHAATMVTAGVYMIARLLPVFELSPYALPTVAVIGALTALLGATIALCQYDLKKVFAYSTVSQLGYMFLAVGVLSTFGGMFHLFTHAFFKALLFLTAGSVMHALAGQLDLRNMSGLRHRMPVTAVLMLIGCLALAGFPIITAGFWSKDAILVAAFERGTGPDGHILYLLLGIVGLVVAFLTAFYTFRLWFRVFTGPERYEMGAEDHGAPEDAEERAAEQPQHAPAAHGHHPHEPHEMPWWPMNAPLVVLAIGAIAAGWFGGWIAGLVDNSTAAVHVEHHAEGNLHLIMMIVSGVVALAGIAAAWYFHLHNRPAADAVAEKAAAGVHLLQRKYYIDEAYHALIVTPLRVVGYVFFLIDQIVIQGVVYSVAWMPRLAAYGLRPGHSGRLQGYGLGMVAGVALIALILLFMIS